MSGGKRDSTYVVLQGDQRYSVFPSLESNHRLDNPTPELQGTHCHHGSPSNGLWRAPVMPDYAPKRKILGAFSRKRAIELQAVVTSILERHLQPEKRQLDPAQTLSLRDRWYVMCCLYYSI